MEVIKLQKPIWQIIRWMWTSTKGTRLQSMLNVSIDVLQVVVSLASVEAVRRAIDIASKAKSGNLYLAIGIMGGIILLDFALSISSIWVRNILGVKAQNRMQQRMLERVLRSEWQGRATHHSGDILNRLEGDVSGVVNFMTETLPGALSTMLLFVGAFLFLFSMDKTLALITIAIVPLCVVLSKFYIMKMRRLNRKVRDNDSRIQSVMQEIVQHMMVIKTLESDDTMIGKLSDEHTLLRRNIVKRTLFSVMSALTMNFGFALSYLIAFGWSAVRLSMNTLTFGGMTAFLQLVNKIQSPARSLAKLIPKAVSVFTAAERLMELEDVPKEEDGDPIVVAAPCGIRLNDVSFRYEPDSRLIFDHFSCDFRPGTATAVVGETGAGKTSLIRLLLALTRPTDGVVEIYSGQPADATQPAAASGAGNALHEAPSLHGGPGEGSSITHHHRCNFVYVPQGNTLMSGTIRDNLLLGKPDATEQELLDALHESCADFVMELPAGLDTVCSEQGGGLSEGQAQRIAIARGLLRNRPVMVFDEATSALDPATERQLLHNILASHHKTVIFITHRMAVCDYCDSVLRLEKPQATQPQ